MADDNQDDASKTEDPTHKRLDEAQKKGNVPFSREITSFLMLAMLALTVGAFAPSILKNTKLLLIPFLASADSLATDQKGIGLLLSHVAFGTVSIIIIPLLGVMASAFASSLLQNGFRITTDPLAPKLERISPLKGLKRLFSMRSLVEFIKGILKIIIVGTVSFIAVYPELAHIRQLPSSDQDSMLLFLATLAGRLTIGAAIAMFFIAVLDLAYQRWQYTKSLRMSKQEIKDEYKQSEGDPVIKQRLRRLRMERARQRMMGAVPESDVVITNPTHYAVALKYDGATMRAPMLVAKGQDLVALKIREVAEEHNVPIVENPPLARALFASTKLEEEIPGEHYEAVAKVISYVYQLKGRKL